MFANLIFDLDGTLVDSLPGIEASLRAALARCQPARALAAGALRPRVGPPLGRIIAALWPDLAAEEIGALVAAYRAHYLAENCGATPAFPDVGATLKTFRASGKRLFILTSKPAAQTHLILARLVWQEWFVEVSCPDTPAHPFTDKAEGAASLRERHALDPAGTLLVGDARDDARAAARAGCAFAWAGYGYGQVGHGISLGKRLPDLGAFADLPALIDPPLPAPRDPHDYPQRF